MTTRWARLARGLVAALVSVFVALCSHALGGGGLPSFAGLSLCLAFATLACVALAGKSLSLPRLATAVAGSQLLFHALFSEFTPSAAVGHVGMQGMHGDVGAGAASVTLHGHSTMPAWMWIAHSVAAIVTVIALRCGERAFWALVQLVVPAVRRIPTPAPIASERPQPTSAPLPVRTQLAPLSVMRHRGPPALGAQ